MLTAAILANILLCQNESTINDLHIKYVNTIITLNRSLLNNESISDVKKSVESLSQLAADIERELETFPDSANRSLYKSEFNCWKTLAVQIVDATRRREATRELPVYSGGILHIGGSGVQTEVTNVLYKLSEYFKEGEMDKMGELFSNDFRAGGFGGRDEFIDFLKKNRRLGLMQDFEMSYNPRMSLLDGENDFLQGFKVGNTDCTWYGMLEMSRYDDKWQISSIDWPNSFQAVGTTARNEDKSVKGENEVKQPEEVKKDTTHESQAPNQP
jgi:hypothetical protein